MFIIRFKSVMGDMVVVRQMCDAAGRRGGVGQLPASDGRVTRVAESTRRPTAVRRGTGRNRCPTGCPRTVRTLSRGRPRVLRPRERHSDWLIWCRRDRGRDREMEALGGLAHGSLRSPLVRRGLPLVGLAPLAPRAPRPSSPPEDSLCLSSEPVLTPFARTPGRHCTAPPQRATRLPNRLRCSLCCAAHPSHAAVAA